MTTIDISTTSCKDGNGEGELKTANILAVKSMNRTKLYRELIRLRVEAGRKRI